MGNNKLLIYEYILSKKTPFTCDELLEELKGEAPNITKLEIYSSITNYLQTGIIKQVVDGYALKDWNE